jgi:hypothetical protein
MANLTKFQVLIKGTLEQATDALTARGIVWHGAASATVENPVTSTTVRASWDQLSSWFIADRTPPFPTGALLHYSEMPPIEWENVNGELRAKFDRDGFNVSIRVNVDPDADISWVEDDAERMRGLDNGSWALYVIDVRVYRCGVELAGDALGGCELHPPFYGPGWSIGDTFEQNATDLIDDCGMIESSIAAARDIIAKLCADTQ